jgi:hypothetical protein
MMGAASPCGALLLAALLTASCAAAAPATPGGAAPPDPISRGLRLAARGDHLGASRYLEASLAAGASEGEVLPLLLAAQVRSGRLLAARVTAARLARLAPAAEGLPQLRATIDEALGAAPSPAEEVIR